MLHNDAINFKSNTDLDNMNNYEVSGQMDENDIYSTSPSTSDEQSDDDKPELDRPHHPYNHHDNHGGYIKKLREKFEKSNEKINAEICRVNPNDSSQIIISELTRNLNRLSDPLISIKEHNNHPKNRTPSNRSVASRKMNEEGLSQHDSESIAPSRKIRRKKIVKIKRMPSRPISEENKITALSRSNTQISETRTHRRVKVIHNKAGKKVSRRKPVKNISFEKNNENISSDNSNNSLRQNKNQGDRRNFEAEQDNKYFDSINSVNEHVTCDEQIDYNDEREMTSVEKLYQNPSCNPIDSSDDIERISLLRNLNLLLRNENNNIAYSQKNEPGRYHISRSSNNYEMPTIASQMKKVNRNTTFPKRQTDSLTKIPFVVGTSVSTTNNVHLLKQLITSKIKTYLMSTVNETQLTGWNVNNLRLLVQGIEKFGGGTYKFRNNIRNRQMMNGQNDINQHTLESRV